MHIKKLKIEYSHDFFNWINQHVVMLKNGNLNELDVEHLIEELEDMGKSNIRELESRFVVLIAHLLKWQFQPNKRSNSWLGSIVEQRIQLLRLLRKSPSLKRELQNSVADAYADAVLVASDETGIAEKNFPNTCPYNMEQLLNREFYPT